jgi:hypothetical protein
MGLHVEDEVVRPVRSHRGRIERLVRMPGKEVSKDVIHGRECTGHAGGRAQVDNGIKVQPLRRERGELNQVPLDRSLPASLRQRKELPVRYDLRRNGQMPIEVVILVGFSYPAIARNGPRRQGCGLGAAHR